jgi:hypothetical protein
VQIVQRELIEEQAARTLADPLVNVSGIMPSQPAENGLVGNIVRGLPAIRVGCYAMPVIPAPRTCASAPRSLRTSIIR